MTQPSDQEIHAIIADGRVRQEESGRVRPVLVLCVLSFGLLWACFTPVEAAPAAWLSLTPLCLLMRTTQLSRRHYAVITVCGWLWAAATLQWMRLGHWSMYFALIALAFYISLYFPVFVGISRRLTQSGIPLWLTVPCVWTSLDFLRARLMTGFPWYFLGHSQYRWIELIQVADVAGVYGVTFLVAMSSAVVAECIPDSVLTQIGFKINTLIQPHRRRNAVSVLIVLVLAAVVYGWWRQQPLAARDGPVIALVQGHFPPDLKHGLNPMRIVNAHDLLTSRAAQEQPDLIVWPETMWPEPDLIVDPSVTDDRLIQILSAVQPMSDEAARRAVDWWRNHNVRDKLIQRSQEAGTSILFGLTTRLAEPQGLKQFNSAALVRPDLGYMGRYDKIHRVVFGEYIPLKSVFPFLATFSPYGSPGIEAGTEPVIFETGGVRYAPVICFEDTIPQLVRRIVMHESRAADRPDVLVNLTNDGWFHGSSELDQHFITSVFRCIETRRPMVRAVNGGISAMIDSSGRIRTPETFLIMTSSGGFQGDFKAVDSLIDPTTGRWYRQCAAVMVGQVPVDGRNTCYLFYGDWFAMLCGFAVVAVWIRSFVQHPDRMTAVSDENGNRSLVTKA